MKLTNLRELKEARYYDPEQVYQKTEDNSFRACAHCGEEIHMIGYGDETLDFCEECNATEDEIMIRYWGVPDKFGTP